MSTNMSVNNWGDKEEDMKQKEFKVGFMLNFKSMTNLLQEMTEYIGEPTDEYPKKELMKLWANLMLIFFVLFFFSKAAIIFITIPFCIFYGVALFNLFQTWKGFKYSKGKFIGATLVTLPVLFVIGMFLSDLILKI